MKNILVPTDFSELTGQIAKVAANAVEPRKGRIHLLHTIHTPTMLDESGFAYSQALFKEAEREMELFVEELELNHQPIVQVEMEPLHIAVESYILDNEIDLVMMPSQGATGLKEWLMGSHAERLVRNASVPVMVVKKPLAYYPPQHMAFASTFEPGERLNTEPLRELQKISRAHLHLVWVLEDHDGQPTEEEMLMRMSEFAYKNGFFQADYHIIYADDVTEGLSKFALTHYVDLLVIGTHSRHSLSRFFHHSIAEEAVNHLPQNIMTFHIETEEVFF